MNDLVLYTIRDIKTIYPFLLEQEGFNLYEDWSDDDHFLVAKDGLRVDGHFYLDFYEDEATECLKQTFHIKEADTVRIEGILVLGNLVATGSVINEEGDYGPFVYIKGNVECQSLLLGGAYVILEGNVTATEVVMTDYNHGYCMCTGTITSPVFIVEDHYTSFAERNNSLFYYNSHTGDHPAENELEEDEGTGEDIIPGVLRAHLSSSLTQDYEELKRDLAAGEWVLTGQTKTIRDAAYWKKKVQVNYRDLGRVPDEYKTRALCMEALGQTFYALEYFPDAFIDEQLCAQVVEKDGFALRVIPEAFITKELCEVAAQKGTLIQFIPERFLSEELIITALKNSVHQPDINDVPAIFITKSLLVQYVLMGKGLWLDKACKENDIDKTDVIAGAIATGIDSLDNIFSNHCSADAFNYAARLYNKAEYAQTWSSYMDKYRNKLKRIGIDV
ncbi:MAG: polymer-forming cytoskeletal protein [Filimonas sp.]|nr:polymer-forming cytoskeletal protein [Filimonas sp.]